MHAKPPSLTYDTKVIAEPRYLKFVFTGTYSRARSEQAIATVRREADERRYSRILVDYQGVPDDVPNLDRFHLGELSAEVLRGLRLAVIDLTEAPDAFVETVAVNRGATMRLFCSEVEALAWLLPPEE